MPLPTDGKAPQLDPSLATKLLGKWRGGRHLTEYRSNGTFVLDADLVPEPATGTWRLEGNKLTQTFKEGNGFSVIIESIAGREMTTSDPATGKKFQSHREEIVWIDFDSVSPDHITGEEFSTSGLFINSSKGRPYVMPAPVPPMSMPDKRKQVLMVDGGFVTDIAFQFGQPVRSVTLVLPGLTGGSSYPTYTLTAYNVKGEGVDMIGAEHWIPNNPEPVRLVMNSTLMSRIVISVDNRFGDTAWATYNCLPIAEIELEW